MSECRDRENAVSVVSQSALKLFGNVYLVNGKDKIVGIKSQ